MDYLNLPKNKTMKHINYLFCMCNCLDKIKVNYFILYKINQSYNNNKKKYFHFVYYFLELLIIINKMANISQPLPNFNI